MATTTPNLGLVKPATTDPADISVINGNMDKLDKLGAIITSATGFGSMSGINQYTKANLESLDQNITTHNTGIIQLSAGGPVHFAILFKYSDTYYWGLIGTYNSSSAYPTLIFKRSGTNYEIVPLGRPVA